MNAKDNNINSFLGRGWGFPVKFDQRSCSVRMVEREEDICESLKILICTAIGERKMRPNYGCNLRRQVFANMSTQFLSFIQSYIEQSIVLYEPRVQLDRVILRPEQTEGRLYIEVQYTVRATNAPENQVYPFMLDNNNNPIP